MSASSALLPHRIARHAAEQPEAVAFRFVDRPGRPGRELTWNDLWAGATATASLLQDSGLSHQRIGVACDDARDFIIALAACFISANAVVPFPVALSRRAAPRARAVAGAGNPRAVILSANGEVPDWLSDLSQSVGTLIIRPAAADAAIAGWDEPPVSASDLAILQFSSGSTGSPKGVGLSHGNIAANCAAIMEAYGLTTETPALSWLPLHHDMGLIGHVVTPMWGGFRSTIMNPLRFLQRPLDWLRLVTEEGSFVTSAPNFAYEICAKVAASQDTQNLHLSGLAVAICGGEPVLASTVQRFLAAFAELGLSPSAFAPSYGLAEGTLLVSSGRRQGGPRFVEARPSAGDAVGEVNGLVADLGPTVKGVTVRIIDVDGGEAVEGSVGEIEISGASVGQLVDESGHWCQPGPVLTGDLGFLRGGHLHIVGRKKDLIIVRGQNIHPSDAEAAALDADAAIVPGGLAAVGIAVDGTEELVVLIEVDKRAASPLGHATALRQRVSEGVARRLGVVPATIVMLKPGALPRTSSGKVRRFEVAAMYAAGTLVDAVATPERA